MDAINQLASTPIWVFLIIGCVGIAMALSGLAILIYRVIRIILKGAVKR